MAWDVFFALAVFAGVMVGTPGPANLLVMAAGARWGVRACLPFIAGLIGGKLLLNALMAGGLLALVEAVPAAAVGLRYASAVYLMYLAWRVAGMRLRRSEDAGRRLPGFFAGVVVHPMNPKAWAMSSSAFAQFVEAGAGAVWQGLGVMAVFLAAQAVFHPLWCYGGVKIAECIGGTVWERRVMRGLAASVVGLVVWAVLR